jgi:hypothetical protein
MSNLIWAVIGWILIFANIGIAVVNNDDSLTILNWCVAGLNMAPAIWNTAFYIRNTKEI